MCGRLTNWLAVAAALLQVAVWAVGLAMLLWVLSHIL